MSNNSDVLDLLFPKSVGFNQLSSANFESVKSFALNMELATMSRKSVSDKIIRSLFTSEMSLKKARKLAVGEKILVNNNVKQINKCMDWEIVVKKILVDLFKLAVESVFSKFGKIQKTVIEFVSSDVASLVASKWLVFMNKDSVCMALIINNKDSWILRNQYQALLYILSVNTIAYDFSGLVEAYNEKTCFIGHNPYLYVHDRCALICFNNEASKLAVIGSVSVFKNPVVLGINNLVIYLMSVCLANIYKKKQALIAYPVSFGGKTWIQIAGEFLSHVVLLVLSSVGSSLSVMFLSLSSTFLSNSGLADCLVVLKYSLELLFNQFFALVKKLDFVELVLLITTFHIPPPVALVLLALNWDLDIVVDNVLMLSALLFSVSFDVIIDFSSNSSKVLTTKMGGLESKMMAIEAGFVSVNLNKLLDMQLNSIHKQANKNCWKFDFKGADQDKCAELIMEPNVVMFKVDVIIEVEFNELFGVIFDLPDSKAAGLSVFERRLGSKLYEWKEVLTNTQPIVLIETAYKILFKILSDKILSACNTFDVLYENNFLVLKDMTTQSPIFVIGLVVKDALEKNWKLWLVLQNM
ncbi:hypothetical protein G9A89_013475 [Geosiphon pyriformis]|nr:hypothetical protein G9A89_013475 [Geosiphon pyriformis]